MPPVTYNQNDPSVPERPVGLWQKCRRLLAGASWRVRAVVIVACLVVVGGSVLSLHLIHHQAPAKKQQTVSTQNDSGSSSGLDAGGVNSPAGSKQTTPASTTDKSGTTAKPTTGSSKISSGSGGTSTKKTTGSGGSTGGSTGGSGTTSLKLAIPTYWFPPASYDSQLDSAGSSKVGFVIANVNSGPGTGGAESNFSTMINNERSAGIKVYGYVYTDYGSRAIATVESDIDSWYSWYNLDGITLDEAPGTGWTSAQKTYYQTLYNYIKAKTGANVHGKTVFLNPGTITDEYAMSVSDIICDYEDVESNYAGTTFPAWTKNYPASRFMQIVHTSAGISQMQADISLAKSRNIGYIFVTTDSGGNPYDTLPSNPFWSDELAAL